MKTIILFFFCTALLFGARFINAQSEIAIKTSVDPHDGKIHVNSEWITPTTKNDEPELVCDSELSNECIQTYEDHGCSTQTELSLICDPCYKLLMSCFRSAQCQNEEWYANWEDSCLTGASCGVTICSDAQMTSVQISLLMASLFAVLFVIVFLL